MIRVYKNRFVVIASGGGRLGPGHRNRLIKLMKEAKLHPSSSREKYEEYLETRINLGYYSFYSQGNYSAKSVLFPDFSLNPSLDGKKLFFTLEHECRYYADRIAKIHKVSEGGIYTIKHGGYEVPRKVSTNEWAVLWRKFTWRHLPDEILEELVKRHLLTERRNRNFSVVGINNKGINKYDFSKKEGDELKIYYFVRQDDAIAFARCLRKRVEVIQHE